MGPAVINATRGQYYHGERKLSLDSFPSTALVTTQSKDSYVTDSAAAASAFACGQKVNNAAICYPESKEQKISDLAKAKGYRVGIITNTTVTHATPAAFYASTMHRSNSPEIIEDLLKSKIDFLIGGSTFVLKKALSKKTRFHLYEQPPKEFQEPFLALYSQGHFPYLKEKKSFPRLKEITVEQVQRLIKADAPFFLVIESGRIDHALHEGDPVTAIEELYDFDKLIGEIRNLIRANSKKNISLFITSDHDTAGIDVSGYPDIKDSLIKNRKITKKTRDEKPSIRFIDSGLSKQNHTAVDVVLFADGPCASSVNGTIDNTEIYHILKRCLNH